MLNFLIITITIITIITIITMISLFFKSKLKDNFINCYQNYILINRDIKNNDKVKKLLGYSKIQYPGENLFINENSLRGSNFFNNDIEFGIDQITYDTKFYENPIGISPDFFL